MPPLFPKPSAELRARSLPGEDGLGRVSPWGRGLARCRGRSCRRAAPNRQTARASTPPQRLSNSHAGRAAAVPETTVTKLVRGNKRTGETNVAVNLCTSRLGGPPSSFRQKWRGRKGWREGRMGLSSTTQTPNDGLQTRGKGWLAPSSRRRHEAYGLSGQQRCMGM
jgi:hypothetical protein